MIPRSRGSTTHDKTCFHPDQEAWGPDRSDRPDILFQYNKPKKSKRHEPLPDVEKLMWNGLVIVDKKTLLPLRDFPNIPLCLSSRVEGWLLEALMRQDSRIIHEDLVARMPLSIRGPDTKTLSMRRSRFRWGAGCKSWVSRSASENINNYLDSLVPKVFQDANCTRGWRDLTDSEVDAMKAASKGKYPERSRAKDQTKKVQQGLSTPDENASQQDTYSHEEIEQTSVLSPDFRDETPSYAWERRAIQRALAPTRSGE